MTTTTTTAPDGAELLTIPEIAAHLKVSTQTVQKWCREGRLPVAKVGKAYRIRRADLTRWYDDKLA